MLKAEITPGAPTMPSVRGENPAPPLSGSKSLSTSAATNGKRNGCPILKGTLKDQVGSVQADAHQNHAHFLPEGIGVAQDLCTNSAQQRSLDGP
jgi:hypothetical protein